MSEKKKHIQVRIICGFKYQKLEVQGLSTSEVLTSLYLLCTTKGEVGVRCTFFDP